MEIINYSEEHRIFRNSLRKYLVKEVIPHVEEWEEAGIVPRSAWKGMGEQGFLCMGVPEEYGGLGADFLYSVIVIERPLNNCCFQLNDLHNLLYLLHTNFEKARNSKVSSKKWYGPTTPASPPASWVCKIFFKRGVRGVP